MNDAADVIIVTQPYVILVPDEVWLLRIVLVHLNVGPGGKRRPRHMMRVNACDDGSHLVMTW